MKATFSSSVARRGVLAAVVLAAALASASPVRAAPPPAEAGAATDGCSGPAEVTGGHRKLALIVAVGRYANPSIPTLAGPPNDARKIYDLLTGEGGYGFPRRNVCRLIDSAATLDGFRTAFDQALVARAQKDDTVVVYYSGHGSQLEDLSGDEANGKDDTWVLHDSRTNGKKDLVDDEVFQLLSRLHEKTSNITVLLDSCNSGSAIRAAGLVARGIPAERLAPGTPARTAPAAAAPHRAVAELPRQLPGVSLLAAARDGTSAFEIDGRGIFTDALIRVLARSATPLSYDQAQRQVRPLVAAESSQVPYFSGDLDRVAFGSESRASPLALRVSGLAKGVTLRGPPLPGLGTGAELRVYDGASTGAVVMDPARSIATVVVESVGGLEWTARLLGRGPAPGDLKVGDLAVLSRPAPGLIRLRVRVVASGPGAVPAPRLQAISAALARAPEAAEFVQLATEPSARADLELSRAPDGALELRDTGSLLRARYPPDATEAASVVANLAAHARQLALLNLVPEGGGGLIEGKTLTVRLVPRPAGEQLACSQGSFKEPDGAGPYRVPMCFRYQVEVELSAESPVPLLVGALFLSSSGKIVPLVDPLDSLLMPGRKKVLGGIVTGPPDGARDTVLAIGTQEKNPIRLDLLATSGGLRGSTQERGEEGMLQRALRRYLKETRDGDADSAVLEDSAWTRTVASAVVRANPEFAAPPADGAATRGDPMSREYTLASFDIRPYLPRDPGSALRRVLVEADWLATSAAAGGVPYKQHAWTAGSDAANLALGIDCSRAIHFAFTRAGLPYNHAGGTGSVNGRYLTTADMAVATGPMADEFDRCDGDPERRTGDVLVYRDDQQGDGHTVMVIDAADRVAWGSHGWDGNARAGVAPETGVQYQKIKYKADWKRWDRPGMQQKACWRYRRFASEARQLDGQPGTFLVPNECRQVGCGRAPPPK